MHVIISVVRFNAALLKAVPVTPPPHETTVYITTQKELETCLHQWMNQGTFLCQFDVELVLKLRPFTNFDVTLVCLVHGKLNT